MQEGQENTVFNLQISRVMFYSMPVFFCYWILGAVLAFSFILRKDLHEALPFIIGSGIGILTAGLCSIFTKKHWAVKIYEGFVEGPGLFWNRIKLPINDIDRSKSFKRGIIRQLLFLSSHIHSNNDEKIYLSPLYFSNTQIKEIKKTLEEYV